MTGSSPFLQSLTFLIVINMALGWISRSPRTLRVLSDDVSYRHCEAAERPWQSSSLNENVIGYFLEMI